MFNNLKILLLMNLMKNFLLLSVLVLITTHLSAQIVADKYEYVLLVQNTTPFEPRGLQIIYPDGKVEKFVDLLPINNVKNYHKNLATLLKAFNFLGSQGYELQSDSRNEKDVLELNN